MNVLIVTGVPSIREQLAGWLAALPGYRPLEAEAASVTEALAQIGSLQPDIVLLDVALPGDGLQVAARLCEHEPAPALVLLGEEAQLAGLRREAIAHLCLPAAPAALAEALAGAVALQRAQLLALLAAPPPGQVPRSHIGARTRRGVEVVAMSEVLYFIADHKYVTLRHTGGELLLDETLKGLEEEFGERLVRIHRNALVMRARIDHLQRDVHGYFQLYLQGLDEASLVVSRRHVSGLRKLMRGLA